MVVVMMVIVVMVVVMIMPVVVPVIMAVAVAMRMAVVVMMMVRVPARSRCLGIGPDRRAVNHCGIAATANRAHQITSRSLIRISSPPCGISLPPPQAGQGSSRCSSSTCCPQS